MVAGIRGTCGVVEKVNPAVSKLYLIEGQVTLGTGENATTVYGGQTATVILRPKNETGESGGSGGSGTPGGPGSTTEQMEQKVYVDKLTEKAVPVFAITEILSNPVLQQKIEATTELKIEKLKEALAESQKEPGAEEKEEEKKPGETTSSGGSYGGSSGGGVSDSPSESGTDDVAGSVEAEIKILTGSAVTVANINKELESGGIVKLTAEPSADGVTSIETADDQGLTVPSGGTLMVDDSFEINAPVTVSPGGVLMVSEGALLSCVCGIENNGTIINNGTLGAVETPVILASGSTLENNGTITGPVTLETGSTFTNSGSGSVNGEFILETGSTLTNRGTITAVNRGLIVSGGEINNTGIINMNDNSLELTGNLTLTNAGTISGRGNSVINLTSPASITLVTSGDSTNGSIINSNSDRGYVIAVDDEILSSDNENVVWNDTGLSLVSSTNNIEQVIQGIHATTDNQGATTITYPSYMKCPDGYGYSFENGTLKLNRSTT